MYEIELLAACKDEEVSVDNERHGAYTEALLAVWADGAFKGTLRQLQRAASRAILAPQTPVFNRYGARDAEFDQSPAFRVVRYPSS